MRNYLIFLLSFVCSLPASALVHMEDKPAFVVTSEQPEFVIKLKSNPTTGFSWFLRDFNAGLVIPVKHIFEAPQDKKLIGAPGYEVWTFKMKPESFVVPQQTTIRFVYKRPWEVEESATQSIFHVATLPK